MENTLSVIPPGGVEEIGLNMTVLEYNDDIIVIDAGLMFPEEDVLGVDFVIPDFSYLINNREKVKAVILTHGHEDHTGALPFLLKEISVPVYGTPLTLGLGREKLLEHTPVDGQLMDFHRFSEYGERGTLLLLSDSTNAEKGGFTFSEKEVRRAFENIFSKTKGRIIIPTFDSKIQ